MSKFDKKALRERLVRERLHLDDRLARADALQDEDGEVLLVGAGHLIERYVHALDWVGVRSRPAVADATVRGLWQSALGAGLIDGGK